MKNSSGTPGNIADLFSKAKSAGESGKLQNEEQVNSFLNETLGEQKAKNVQEVLSDEKKLKALLESDRAQAIINKLKGGGNNG